MNEEIWFRPWVWLDYKIAVVFTVLVPLVLLVWSLIRRNTATTQLLMIYWRVASLLMITVYLLIPAWSFGFLTGFAARILIPIALWFWVDLNEEIADQPASLFKGLLTGWRWAVSIYCGIGTFVMIPFLSCAFSTAARSTPFCRVWLEAPFYYRELIHGNSRPGFLGFLGLVGLTIYLLYFVSFLLTRLGKRGRSALEQEIQFMVQSVGVRQGRTKKRKKLSAKKRSGPTHLPPPGYSSQEEILIQKSPLGRGGLAQRRPGWVRVLCTNPRFVS